MALPPRPTAIRAPHGATVLGISWSDGRSDELPHRLVRGFCPCATCQGHRAGTRYQEGGSDELRELQTVGNYALALTWGDGHTGGIYSFAYLRRLGELLRQQGLPALIAAGSLPAEE